MFRFWLSARTDTENKAKRRRVEGGGTQFGAVSSALFIATARGAALKPRNSPSVHQWIKLPWQHNIANKAFDKPGAAQERGSDLLDSVEKFKP